MEEFVARALQDKTRASVKTPRYALSFWTDVGQRARTCLFWAHCWCLKTV